MTTTFKIWSFCATLILVCLTQASFAQYGRYGGGYGGGGFGHRITGTEINEEHQLFMRSHRQAIQNFNDSTARGIREYPIKVHILRENNGGGGIGVTEIKEAIQNLNYYFLPADIRFVTLDDYNYINNDDYYKFDKSTEDALCKIHDVPGVINLYIVKSIKTERNTYNSYTYFPLASDNIDRVFIRQKSFNDGVSLVREMGHYFSLYPTHGPNEDMTTEELVNGTNCATTGDEICDTPADPKLSGTNVNERCEYTGAQKDGNRKFFRPDTDNFMCHSTKTECITRFTDEQYSRMMYAAQNLRNYHIFPRTEFSKKQIKTLEEDYGIETQIELTMDGRRTAPKLDQNLYLTDETYRSGANYLLNITTYKRCYVYILEGDTERGMSLIYPKAGDKEFFKDGKNSFDLPLSIDQEAGDNYLCILFAKKQLSKEDLQNKPNEEAPDNFTPVQRLYNAFGNQILSISDIEYEKNKIGLNAITGERYIVPIFIHYEHN